MKNVFRFVPAMLMAFFLFANSSHVQAQCVPADATVSAANTVVNTYYPATASVTAGIATITLGAASGGATITPITSGDLLLIIQMQGADINSAQSDAYGDGAAGGPASGYLTATAGTYEFKIASNSVGTGGGTLYLTSGTTHAYTASAATSTQGTARYQVIRVPRYRNLTVTGGGITAPAWNGAVGGVVSFEVTGTMSVGGTFINVSAKGFRGGGGRQLAGIGTTTGFARTDVRTLAGSNVNGSKGEGIAGTPRFVRTSGTTTVLNTAGGATYTYPGGSNGMGAPGNAGGGATDGTPADNGENAGGGGGGNGGPGGRGGNAWNSTFPSGGYGGVRPGFLANNRLILGGGGGAGSNNNGTGETPAGIGSSGGAGGGLVLIKVNAVSGSGTISANGEVGGSVLQDGAGGGGAGGTVYISANGTSNLSGITVTANGGNGGDANFGQLHGPGGGGGGGVIYATRAVGASSVAAGSNGVTTNSNAFGATAGAAGTIATTSPALTPIYNSVCNSFVLPVKFKSFSAIAQTDGIALTWIVTDEQNVKAYEVEKSTDGVSFTKIGVLPYHSANAAENEYAFTDAASAAPVRYYRIRQVDVDGRFMYSAIVSVRQRQPAGQLSVSPNPVQGQAHILISAAQAQKVKMNVADMQGKVVLSQLVTLQKGQNSVPAAQLQSLPKGSYIIMAEVDGQVQQTKFVKK